MPDALRMVRLRVEARRLYELARRRRLSARAEDVGYLVHCQLKELFGDDAPAPFSVLDGAGRWLTVLGYSTRPAAELVDYARTYADPAALAGGDLSTLVDKELPSSWSTGKILGFEVRACPVVRLASDLKLDGAGTMRKGAEVDAFLARCWRTDEPMDRDTVYREWLAKEIDRRGGLRLISTRLEAHKRTGLLRRTQGDERKSRVAERPDVTFTGVAEVVDGAAFSTLLARGIGRHRAFGFGMLLLRPPRPEC
jgi:CRISPR system Cascade subunit CasE